MQSIIMLEGDFGPKMKALPNDNWREFVRIYCRQGGRNASRAYALAYGIDPNDKSKHSTYACGGWRLLQDDRCLAAILECTEAGLRAAAPLAKRVMLEIAEGEQFAASDRLRASIAIADRVGMHAKSEHKVTVERIDQDEGKMRRILLMAQQMGVPIESLAGSKIAEQAKLIDMTPEPVANEQHSDEWDTDEY